MKPLPTFDQLNTQLFWAYADKPSEKECWNWLGPIAINGYGRFARFNQIFYAHRISYFLATGIDPAGKLILHSCDNPKCVNPAHLRMGNDLENSKDKFERGRENFQQGENHHGAKLTATQVREIRRLCADGNISQGEIAKIYGIKQGTVSEINTRHKWNSIE